jgi:hypothetical protein
MIKTHKIQKNILIGHLLFSYIIFGFFWKNDLYLLTNSTTIKKVSIIKRLNKLFIYVYIFNICHAYIKKQLFKNKMICENYNFNIIKLKLGKRWLLKKMCFLTSFIINWRTYFIYPCWNIWLDKNTFKILELLHVLKKLC